MSNHLKAYDSDKLNRQAISEYNYDLNLHRKKRYCTCSRYKHFKMIRNSAVIVASLLQ